MFVSSTAFQAVQTGGCSPALGDQFLIAQAMCRPAPRCFDAWHATTTPSWAWQETQQGLAAYASLHTKPAQVKLHAMPTQLSCVTFRVGGSPGSKSTGYKRKPLCCSHCVVLPHPVACLMQLKPTVQTRITYNGGGSWQNIKAPPHFTYQKCDRCGGAKECSLHLHGGQQCQQPLPPVLSVS